MRLKHEKGWKGCRSSDEHWILFLDSWLTRPIPCPNRLSTPSPDPETSKTDGSTVARHAKCQMKRCVGSPSLLALAVSIFCLPSLVIPCVVVNVDLLQFVDVFPFCIFRFCCNVSSRRLRPISQPVVAVNTHLMARQSATAESFTSQVSIFSQACSISCRTRPPRHMSTVLTCIRSRVC